MAAPTRWVVPHIIEFEPQLREALLTLEDYLAQLDLKIVAGGGGGSGVTAHSALTGLGADDHTQYLRPVEVLSGTNVTVTDNGDGTVTVTGTVDELDELTDVGTTGKTTGTVLTFDSSQGATGLWVPQVPTLDDLGDVALPVLPTKPNHNAVLTYDSTSSQWIPYDPFSLINGGEALAAEVLTSDSTGRGRVYYGPPDGTPGLLPNESDLYFATLHTPAAAGAITPPAGVPVVTVT